MTLIRVLNVLFLRDKKIINNAISVLEKYPKLTWRGMAHILTFVNFLEMLLYLKASGCRELFVGIKSGSVSMRKKINKPGTPDQIIKVITALLQTGIDVKGYFMYGFQTKQLQMLPLYLPQS